MDKNINTENRKLVLGVDYETIDSIISKSTLKTRQAINYRINVLRTRGVIVKTNYNSNRNAYWLKEDADKILNIKFTKKRCE